MSIRNTKITCLLTLILWMTTSCNKILDVQPDTTLTFEKFWLTKDNAVSAVAGIYASLGTTNRLKANGASLSSLSPIESMIIWGDLRSDLLAINLSNPNSVDAAKNNVNTMIVSPADVTTDFTAFYRIINLCNQAIKYIPGIVEKDPGLSELEAKQLVGEAYFLRAYTYFWLVRTFRDVPLVLEASERDDQDYLPPVSGASLILAQIVKDLDIAKANLPTWYASSVYSHCRATKYTAMTVLADTYLWMAASTQTTASTTEYYTKALENCDGVINSGRYFLVPGPSFGDIFRLGNSDEAIFETYSNFALNNQVNNIAGLFGSTYVVPASLDDLFDRVSTRDYRSSNPPSGPIPAGGSKVGYDKSNRFIFKYNNSTGDPRWIYYRYADLLLMKAEALTFKTKNDPTAINQALALVNQVRYRAYGVPDYVRAVGSSSVDVGNAILDERGRELFGEGKRYFDILRFALRDNAQDKSILISRIVNSFQGSDQLIISPRIQVLDSWYMPINADAIAVNPNIKQNPYYN